jgi:hypothetical protein
MKALTSVNSDLIPLLEDSFSVLTPPNLTAARMPLGQLVGQGDRLVVFLRHFGCTFCRELVSELTRARSIDSRLPEPIYVFIGSPEDGAAFFKRWSPTAAAVSDPEQKLYRAFGVERGSFTQLLGPQAIACGIQGLVKGYGVGVPKTDPWLMPGLFHIRNARVVWMHDFAHAGDHPDFSKLPAQLGLAK